MSKVRLNLPAIDESLRLFQSNFEAINQSLRIPRSPLTDESRFNMMEGYAFIDQLLADGINLYEPGNASRLLELNTLVLCGSSEKVRQENRQHIEATYNQFYERQSGEIDQLIAMLRNDFSFNIWRRAASVYIHILAQPQLYIEGNHRTGALLMSYILVSEGKPPFVLNRNNASSYFDPSSLAKEVSVHGIDTIYYIPRLTVQFSRLLKSCSQETYLQ